jgi:hypothetical protein
MTDRVGTCQACGSRFKIPPTFQGTRAKCKKCGGVVDIAAEGAAAPPPPPAAAPRAPAPPKPRAAAPPPPPPARPTPGAGGVKPVVAAGGARAGRLRDRAADEAQDEADAPATGAGRRSGAGRLRGKGAAAAGRGRAGGRERKKDNTMLFVGIGAIALIGIVALVYFMSGGDEPQEQAVAQTDTAPAPVETPVEQPVVEPEPEPLPEPEPEPEPEPVAPEPEPEAAAPSDPVVAFEPLPKLESTSDEDWTAIQDAVRVAYLESSRPAKTKEAKERIKAAGLDAVPALINGFNGLNLADENDFPRATNLVFAIQTQSGLGIKFETDAAKKDEQLANNLTSVSGIRKHWAEKSVNPDWLEKQKVRAAEAAAAAEAEDG